MYEQVRGRLGFHGEILRQGFNERFRGQIGLDRGSPRGERLRTSTSLSEERNARSLISSFTVSESLNKSASPLMLGRGRWSRITNCNRPCSNGRIFNLRPTKLCSTVFFVIRAHRNQSASINDPIEASEFWCICQKLLPTVYFFRFFHRG